MKRFTRTDLACEREGAGVVREFLQNGYRVCEREERMRQERARFVTLYHGSLACMEDAALQKAAKALADLLGSVASRAVAAPRCVLVACLGNPRITPDSLGPATARALQVTRHVQLLDPAAFARFGRGSLCTVVPGVLGDTGVESAELVRGVAAQVGAELVITVDALAASSWTHLGSVVQMSDRGLRPGSGMGNRRVAIDRESVGCPVVSIGIPTVTDGAGVICDALRRAGICGVGKELSEHLARAGSYAVAPCDVDVLVERGAALLARAIEDCFGVGTD